MGRTTNSPMPFEGGRSPFEPFEGGRSPFPKPYLKQPPITPAPMTPMPQGMGRPNIMSGLLRRGFR